MKNAVIYLVSIFLLSSCGMSSNFNSQKFTGLKKIKPQKTEMSDSKMILPEESDNVENEPTYYALEEKQEISEQFNLDKNNLKGELLMDGHHPQQFERSTNQTEDKKPLRINSSNNEDDVAAADKILTASTILFWIGVAAAILQFITLIIVLIINAEAFLLFGWIPQMGFLLLFGTIMIVSFISAIITAIAYKNKAQASGAEPVNSRWKVIWITALSLGLVFFGNLLYTTLLYINEFF